MNIPFSGCEATLSPVPEDGFGGNPLDSSERSVPASLGGFLNVKYPKRRFKNG